LENVTLELSNKEFLVKDLNEEIEEKKKTKDRANFVYFFIIKTQ